MKKKSLLALIALIVACMMVFAACGGGSDNEADKNDDGTTLSTEASTDGANTENDDPAPAPAVKTDAEKVADYVAANENELISNFEEGFSASGMTCNSTVEATGTGIYLKVCINEIDNLTADQKEVMQDAFSEGDPSFDAGFEEIQAEIPELTYIKIDICEADGDLLATLKVEDKADAPVVDEPEEIFPEDDPTTSVGSVTYSMMSDDNQVLEGVTFLYNADGNVTEVILEIVSNPDATITQETLDGFEQTYDGFEQIKNMGYDVEADYTTIDGEHYFEGTITVSGANEVSLIADLLGANFTGSTIKLADAEAATIAQGYTLFEG